MIENDVIEGDQTTSIPQIYAHKMQTAQSMQGERRVVTILFCDVAGSTELAGSLDPEIWAEIMHEAFNYLVTPIYRYEGTVARLMGDAVLAFFGAPIAHEDDSERAVLAGLDILSEIRPFADELKHEFDLEFNVRVGINTGPVVVGEIGSDLAMEYTAMGDAANVAARMEQSAAPGTILVSEATYRKIAPLFDVEDKGPIDLKGKQEPVNAYEVTRTKARPGSTRGIEGLPSPLIGRADELNKLQAALTDLTLGRGSIITLLGEAGLGKSRLIRELHSGADDLIEGQVDWYFASGISYNQSTPFGVFHRMFKRMISMDRSGRDQQDGTGVSEFLASFPDADRDAIQLAVDLILGLKPLSDLEEKDAERRKNEVFKAVRKIFRVWCETRPLVLVLDDLHWADPVSVELIISLYGLSDELPILFVCSLRPHRNTPGWQVKLRGETDFPHRYSEIHLQPLSADESQQLIDEILTISKLPDHLRKHIQTKAEGNPFFVEEVIRMLIDQEVLIYDDEKMRWVAIKPPEEIIIPDSLNALLTARIDRLPTEVRSTLQYASVIGRSFSRRVLSEVLSVNGNLQDHLSMLQKYELIRETARTPEIEYSFNHELTRDATYRTVLHRQRRRFHRQVGQVLETMYSGHLEEQAGRLGYHFECAGNDLKALHFYTLAGDHAAGLYANDEAISAYRSALTLAEKASAQDPARSDLIVKLGRVYEVSGRYDEALALYRELVEMGVAAQDQQLELEGLLNQVTIYSVPTLVRDRDLGRTLAERALEIAEGLNDPAAQAKTHWNLMLQDFYQGIEFQTSLSHGEHALRLAREHGLDDQLPFILNDLARAYATGHQIKKALETQQESEQMWRERGNLPMLADNLTAAADIHFGLGGYDKARELLDESLEISRKIESHWGQAYSMMVYGPLAIEQGEFSRGIQMMEECQRISKQANFFPGMFFTPIYLSWIYASLGAKVLAFENANLLDKLVAEFPSFHGRGAIIMARVLAFNGELEEAYSLVEKSVGQLEELAPDMSTGLLLFTFAGDIMLQHGNVEEAGELLTKVEAITREYESIWCNPDLVLLKARIEFALGNTDQASAALNEARQESERLGSVRSRIFILSAMADYFGDGWDKKERTRFSDDAGALIDAIVRGIDDQELVECFLQSEAVQIIQNQMI